MGSRFTAVDALRGLIMIVMAIDHSNAYIARQHSSEFWNGAVSSYSSSFAFLTRLVTHLCAPGFFFLMGAGIYWFAASRVEAGWSERMTMRRTAWRGFAILLVGQFLENPILFGQSALRPPAESLSSLSKAIPNDGGAVWWGFITLSGLGGVMIVCSLLLALRPWAWLLVGGACMGLTNTLLPGDGVVKPLWETVLLAPGLSSHLLVMYPVLPWLAVACAGMYFGHWWKKNPAQQGRVWMVGLGLVAVGVALRALGGWGNIVAARDGSWIEFLNNVKYPPSLVFWTLSVGVDLLLLSLLMRLPEGVRSSRSPLVVFGQTPLFFYVVHFYVLMAIALLFFREAGSLEMAYAVWVVVLGILYFACSWYRGVKRGKGPESVWRLF